MAHQNMSDIIEEYLKSVLAKHEEIEIRRSEIANRFDCVPSQINYVINTRFTIQQGYLVESKRGGGGYIRINRVKMLDEVELIDHMIDVIGSSINEKDGIMVIQSLFTEELISKREAKLMLIPIDRTMLTGETRIDNRLRANILKTMLESLRYQELNNDS